MTVETYGNIKPYYIQALCLLYFPGEKFSGEDSGRRISVSEEERSGEVAVTAAAFAEGREERASFGRKLSEDFSRDTTVNICVGRAVCEVLTKITGFTPPWGSLVGVRCSKIPRTLIESGLNPEEAAEVMTRNYGVTPAKALLAAQVAKNELSLLSSLIPDGVSVYISVPFCPTRCAYCSFVSYSTPGLLKLIPEYTERLCADISRLFEVIRRTGRKVETVYIGGGTPTILGEELLEKLLSVIDGELERCGFTPKEFTLEAGRPDTVTEGKLRSAAAHGVNRVSVNPQTTSDDVLAAIGRAHTAEDFFRAYSVAEGSGIKHINTDLIAGLPGDTPEIFEKSLRDVAGLRPDNITVHTFSVKRSSFFKESGESVYDAAGKDAAKCVSFASEFLAGKNYLPYYMYRQKNMAGGLENTGYSLPGCEGRYNVLIMEEVQTILACGAGAVTKIVTGEAGEKIKRLFLPKYPYEYLREDRFADILSEIEKGLV